MRIFGEGFPVTTLHPMADKVRQAEVHLQQVMEAHPDNRYTTAEKEQLGLELDLILSSDKKRKRRKSDKPQANRALHQLGYEIVRAGKKEKTIKATIPGRLVGQAMRITRRNMGGEK